MVDVSFVPTIRTGAVSNQTPFSNRSSMPKRSAVFHERQPGTALEMTLAYFRRAPRNDFDTLDLELCGHMEPEHPAQRAARREVTAHAVNPAAGRRGRRAQKDVWGSGRVGVRLEHGSEQQLARLRAAAVDVAAYVVRIVRFEIHCVLGRPGENDFAKTRREPLDLRLDSGAQVLAARMRRMAIRPGDVFAGGRSRGVEQRGLHDQD